jgi:hypothetical protein
VAVQYVAKGLRTSIMRPSRCEADIGEFKTRRQPVEQSGHSDHVVNDFATALACSMNNCANGPGVRFFMVRIAIA